MSIKKEHWAVMKVNPDETMISITNWLVEGRGLLAWVRHHGLTYSTVWQFIAGDERRRGAYEAAMTVAGHALFDQAIEVLQEPPRLTDDGKIDHAWVALQRAKSDALRWQAARLNVKYADRQQIELRGPEVSLHDALREARQRVGITLEHEPASIES